jgi:glycosyltransferase involved in cell wall biosynthesis
MIERERMVLAGSAAAIGVSSSLTQSLREQFGAENALRVISNGFDPEELAQIPKLNFEHPAVVYTGTFYPPKRSVEPLMAALQKVDELGRNQRPWAFHYYGYQGEYVRRVAEEHRVENRVVIHGNVPRREALAAVRGADLAVVISSIYERASLQDKGIVTGKVFEAIGVGTPLLVIAPEGSDLDGVLSVTGLGRRFAGTEIDGIAAFLQQTLNGETPPVSNPDPFSWINIVDRLDGVLREVLHAKRGD